MNPATLIGDRLRSERERLGLSQEALAEKAGLGRKTQYNYEEGGRSPDAMYLVSAATLGIDVAYVLTGVHLPDAYAGQFQAAAVATLLAAEPSLAEQYVEAVVRQGAEVLQPGERALIADFRRLSTDEQAIVVSTANALASKRGARPRQRSDASVNQTIHGDVGQVVKAKSVVTGDVVMGGKSRAKK